ncbi:MAG: aminoglycoside phosphotransferase family protein [Marivita sp.]|uniref:phosphotransferase family protein n=1 Tax=Marivita sp. TaxID=2003365 RepID=UPI0025C19CB5|nr:aminoglycoside phosphotransferase family protein [Marivita sp.]MCI5112121.1 aminoglycoside phosphotransferase family protein [Marivita sp.]
MTRALDLLERIDCPQQAPGLMAAMCEVFGEQPASITLERTHFPGNKPVQQVLCAAFPDGRHETVFAEECPIAPGAHVESIRASLGKSRNGQRPGLHATSVVASQAMGLVLRKPGLDERLPGLRLLHDPVFARAALRNLFGTEVGPVVVDLVAHRLGKRAVVRIRGAGLDVFVRLRAIKSEDGDMRLKRHHALWHSLSRQTDLRIPEPLGALPDIGAAVFGVLPGDPADLRARDVGSVARAVSALQGLELAGLPVHSGTDEARLLSLWLERCRIGQPEIARRIAPDLIAVMAALQQASATPRPCHRDLHEKQILVSDGVAGLLDFDTLCLSDPALDVGNLLAHLVLAGQDEAPLRSAFDLPGIGLWRRAALFRLAMIYAFTSTPEAVLDRLIEEAQADAED